MSVELKSVRDRIQETGLFSYVGDTVEAADAMTNMSAPAPAAYVSTAREAAAPNRNSTGRHTQKVVADISVLFALGAERADARLTDEVEEKRLGIIDAMVGWQPEGAGLPCDYVSYSVRFIGEGLFWGELFFRTVYLVQKDAA